MVDLYVKIAVMSEFVTVLMLKLKFIPRLKAKDVIEYRTFGIAVKAFGRVTVNVIELPERVAEYGT